MIWIGQARSQNVPLSGPILMEKADSLAKKLGYSEFKCSSEWLEQFKGRHGLTFKKIVGESGTVSSAMTQEWISTSLPALLSEFKPEDIYNADETGLFYKCLPEKTFAMKGDTCKGGKLSKERLTVLVAANMTGSDKLPLLAIGKFAKPRCFKGIQTLPVQYEANQKGWMGYEVRHFYLLAHQAGSKIPFCWTEGGNGYRQLPCSSKCSSTASSYQASFFAS